MYALLKKELWTYFGSIGAYVVALVFIVISALFLWYLENNFNVFEIGNADAKSFFQLAPWILLFLIPALTMRSFAEEYQLGTLFWLFSKPIRLHHIILAKFISISIVVLFCLIPSVIFIYSIYHLSLPEGNVDLGVIFSSYMGLILLSLTFIFIGIFSSILTKNMVYAYLMALFLNFFMYFGFERIAYFDTFGTWDYFIKNLGFTAHYLPFTYGLIDTRDVAYFLGLQSILLLSSVYFLFKMKKG